MTDPLIGTRLGNYEIESVIAKGGITSSDVAAHGLEIRHAIVRGPMLPGIVSLWEPVDGPATGLRVRRILAPTDQRHRLAARLPHRPEEATKVQRVARFENSSSRSMMAKARSGVTSKIRFEGSIAAKKK